MNTLKKINLFALPFALGTLLSFAPTYSGSVGLKKFAKYGQTLARTSFSHVKDNPQFFIPLIAALSVRHFCTEKDSVGQEQHPTIKKFIEFFIKYALVYPHLIKTAVANRETAHQLSQRILDTVSNTASSTIAKVTKNALTKEIQKKIGTYAAAKQAQAIALAIGFWNKIILDPRVQSTIKIAKFTKQTLRITPQQVVGLGVGALLWHKSPQGSRKRKFIEEAIKYYLFYSQVWNRRHQMYQNTTQFFKNLTAKGYDKIIKAVQQTRRLRQ